MVATPCRRSRRRTVARPVCRTMVSNRETLSASRTPAANLAFRHRPLLLHTRQVGSVTMEAGHRRRRLLCPHLHQGRRHPERRGMFYGVGATGRGYLPGTLTELSSGHGRSHLPRPFSAGVLGASPSGRSGGAVRPTLPQLRAARSAMNERCVSCAWRIYRLDPEVPAPACSLDACEWQLRMTPADLGSAPRRVRPSQVLSIPGEAFPRRHGAQGSAGVRSMRCLRPPPERECPLVLVTLPRCPRCATAL